jgi:hypothetical protein
MPSRKQRRRREKLKRHEWEDVYVDEEGRELDPEEAEIVAPGKPAKAAKAGRTQAAQRGRRSVEPPSWRRTLRRGLLFFPLMLITVFLLGGELAVAAKIVQALVLMAFFLPFSYFMDSVLWRTHQRRLEKAAGSSSKKR